MFNKQYNNIVGKICVRLLHIKKRKRKVFIVLSGAQGSGKTTLTKNLKDMLSKSHKVLSLSIENRNMDIKAYLEETFSKYQKLIEKSCVISKKIVDKLTPLQDAPEMPSQLSSEQTSYDESINI